MILDPFPFYLKQAEYGPLSWTSVAGLFIVFTTKTELTRQVFTEAGNFRPWLSLGAERILTKKAIPFIFGDPHKALRNVLLPLFTPRALSVYLPLQEKVVRSHVKQMIQDYKEGKDVIVRYRSRDINIEISINVFLSPTLPKETRELIAKHYFAMNEGFLCFPIYFPGTTLWKAVRAREQLVEILRQIVRDSRERMLNGETPACLLDIWQENNIKREKEGADNPNPDATMDVLPEDTIIFTTLSFLFASQDATTSALTYAAELLIKHPSVLERVRAEQDEINARVNAQLTPEQLKEDKLYSLLDLSHFKEAKYRRQVVQEILRFRPPATMVPHVAIEDTQMTDGFVCPRGTVLLPSIWDAQLNEQTDKGYVSPTEFNPDRFADGEASNKHFLAFGAGPHLCLGREYAKNVIEIFVSTLADLAEWESLSKPGGDEIIFMPTIIPKDGFPIKITNRVKTTAVTAH
eukprot:TRINITY_DN7204_c0_g1_i1.p1 TRINITY_DN7204_c0_g1~~TRINITY_DN7204_c0_g1_i1.p1  ORF type:complete len:463 (+),score=91.96 TRINITY_DN7204_c0_g1_i1:622-2010(+)